MNNFNLLASTSRFNEKNATAELWFTLLMCGDAFPIISGIQFPGLITALTYLNPKIVISIPLFFIATTPIASIQKVL